MQEGKAKDLLEQTLQRADQAVAEGRSAVYDLRCSSTITNDLAEAVKALGDELAASDSAAFRLTVEGTRRNLHTLNRLTLGDFQSFAQSLVEAGLAPAQIAADKTSRFSAPKLASPCVFPTRSDTGFPRGPDSDRRVGCRCRWTGWSCSGALAPLSYFECKAAATMTGLGVATLPTISFSAGEVCSLQPRSSPDTLERK